MAYKSNQGTEILSNYRSMFAPKLPESIRDKIVEDVMRFPTQERRKARLTKLIQKMDRIGVNHSDVVSLLKKLRAQGATFPPGYLKELMGLLKNNYMMGKSRRRVKKGKQTRKK